jgi:gliding motility-associated lipoprotein GldJ
MKRSMIAKISIAAFAVSILASCQKETSTSTGWEYNNVDNGGFEKADFEEQRTGPGLVMIEGGTFTMGRTEEDVFDDNNNRPNRFTVSSFYMDRTEVTNFHWLEYVYWMKRVYNKTYPHIYKKALPDTLCWRDPLSYREKFVEYYFRYPAYRDYPVVGVSWIQANDFCKWRTDRVNEYILVEQGILKWHFSDEGDLAAGNDPAKKGWTNSPENMFNTESYLAGQYNIEAGSIKTNKQGDKYGEGYTLAQPTKKEIKGGKDKTTTDQPVPRDPYILNDYDPVNATGKLDDGYYQGKRLVRMEDGILLPKYRLPTEAEWEYAATGLLGNLDPNSENIDERRIYPWDGHYVRYDEEQFQGTIQANFVRGTGDHMGIAGALNDGADATTNVDAYWPNDFGLYNMAGNVSEWVMDTYRPTTSDLAEGFMPFRGNMYQTKLMVPDGLHDKYVKSKDNIYDVYGMKEFVNEYARVLYLSNTQNGMNPKESYSSKMDAQKVNNSFVKPFLNIKVDAMGDNASAFQDLGDVCFIAIGDSLKFSNQSLYQNQVKLGFNVTKKAPLQANDWKSIQPSTADGFVVDPRDINKKFWIQSGGGQAASGTGTGATAPAFPAAYGDSIVHVKFNKLGTTIIEYTFGNEVWRKEIHVLGSKDDFAAINPNDYTKAIGSKVLSRQDQQKYKFNSLNKGYIANNKNYSKLDEARFKVLDDINAVLDTAIYLYNQDKSVEASAYIEKVLFGGYASTDVKVSDYRKGHFDQKFTGLATLANQSMIINEKKYDNVTLNIGRIDNPGVYYLINRDPAALIADVNASSIFGGKPIEATSGKGKAKSTIDKDTTYLGMMLPGFETDPTIATWVLNLRNGLTEHTIESRGKQRWRNVTEEENIGRLNYRKDDYIDYLDGDLESSIFYNNKKRIQDINEGKLSSKNTVYQSEHENMDLQGNTLDPSATGWPTTLISDKSKVYKGGSWADRAYWLSAGNRRFLDEDKTSATIGFRCAMDRLGGQRNLNYKKRRR